MDVGIFYSQSYWYNEAKFHHIEVVEYCGFGLFFVLRQNYSFFSFTFLKAVISDTSAVCLDKLRTLIFIANYFKGYEHENNKTLYAKCLEIKG